MIHGKKVLAIIPARGGSKGLPGKNIREVSGKPLLAWTIEEAKKSAYVDRLILSSEDPKIIEIANRWGCDIPFIRPQELAADHTPGIEPVLHAISMLPGYEIIVLLQVTSPQRKVSDIDGCIFNLISSGAKACVSVTEVKQSPYWMYKLRGDGIIAPLITTDQKFVRRQDVPAVYLLNGAVYAAYCDWLTERKTFIADNTFGFVMPNDRSIDIDTEADLREFAAAVEKNPA